VLSQRANVVLEFQECIPPPNKSLQRSGTHKVLGRGRPSKSAHERCRARVLKWRRAAAELGR
jgi:hypothetical protein